MTDHKKPDLLPCPFCGSGNLYEGSPGSPYVTCNECSAFGPSSDFHYAKDMVSEAITAWNTRAPAAAAEGLSAEQVGEWCNVLTHAYMYVTERSHANAQTGIKAVLDDLRKLQTRLSAAPAPAEAKPAEDVYDVMHGAQHFLFLDPNGEGDESNMVPLTLGATFRDKDGPLKAYYNADCVLAPKPAEGGGVTEEMVDAAHEAVAEFQAAHLHVGDFKKYRRELMRAALEAALRGEGVG